MNTIKRGIAVLVAILAFVGALAAPASASFTIYGTLDGVRDAVHALSEQGVRCGPISGSNGIYSATCG